MNSLNWRGIFSNLNKLNNCPYICSIDCLTPNIRKFNLRRKSISCWLPIRSKRAIIIVVGEPQSPIGSPSYCAASNDVIVEIIYKIIRNIIIVTVVHGLKKKRRDKTFRILWASVFLEAHGNLDCFFVKFLAEFERNPRGPSTVARTQYL